MEPTDTRDPAEMVRVAILVLGLALNVWMMWDYLRERPDVMIARRRLEMWWKRHVQDPERRAQEMRRMEGEMPFEATSIVEGK